MPLELKGNSSSLFFEMVVRFGGWGGWCCSTIVAELESAEG